MERNIFCPSCHRDVVIKMKNPYKSERPSECECGAKFWVEKGVIQRYYERAKDDDS